MKEIRWQIAQDSPCDHCGYDVPLNVDVCESCDEIVFTRIPLVDMINSFLQGDTLDARAGGLVWGGHTEEDDILMWRAVNAGVFQLTGRMQGGEYIVNVLASNQHKNRLMEMNEFKGEYVPMTTIPLTDTTRIFNTNRIGDEYRLALYIDAGQFIMNRAATNKYYSELEEINNSVPRWEPAPRTEED